MVTDTFLLSSIPVKENIDPQIERIIKDEVYTYLQDYTGKKQLSKSEIEEKVNAAKATSEMSGSSFSVSLSGIDDEVLKSNIEKKINSLLPTMIEDTLYIHRDIIIEQIKPQIIEMIGGALSC